MLPEATGKTTLQHWYRIKYTRGVERESASGGDDRPHTVGRSKKEPRLICLTPKPGDFEKNKVEMTSASENQFFASPFEKKADRR